MTARAAQLLVLVLIALLALPGGAEGLVLCLCHDGHVQVEFGCEPESCCPPAECSVAHEDGTDEAHMPAHTKQHSCTDIPLPAGTTELAAAPAAPLQKLTPSVQLPAVPTVTLLAGADAAPRLTGPGDPEQYTSPISLRSVILLI
jgi:hypothetical protein